MEEEKLKKIKNKLRENGAESIILVGSYARNEQTEESDIDIIVDFKDKKSLLEIVRLQRELSEEINIDVDLLTRNSINPLILKEMEKDKVVVV